LKTERDVQSFALERGKKSAQELGRFFQVHVDKENEVVSLLVDRFLCLHGNLEEHAFTVPRARNYARLNTEKLV
jgi:hypothetical protein